MSLPNTHRDDCRPVLTTVVLTMIILVVVIDDEWQRKPKKHTHDPGLPWLPMLLWSLLDFFLFSQHYVKMGGTKFYQDLRIIWSKTSNCNFFWSLCKGDGVGGKAELRTILDWHIRHSVEPQSQINSICSILPPLLSHAPFSNPFLLLLIFLPIIKLN